MKRFVSTMNVGRFGFVDKERALNSTAGTNLMPGWRFVAKIDLLLLSVNNGSLCTEPKLNSVIRQSRFALVLQDEPPLLFLSSRCEAI